MSLPVVMWAFGFATTLLLIGMWGRTVAVDEATVEETAKTVVDAELASDRVYGWLEEGLATASEADPDAMRGVASAIAERPEFSAAVDTIVDDFIAGLFAEEGEDPVVRVEEALAPLVPVVVAEANRRDIPVETQRIEEALDAASVIELDTGEAASVASVVDDARSFLTRVVVLASFMLAVTGSLAIVLSETRYAMVRTLGVRVLLSAVTYALLFRVGSWALDPERGRSPVLGGGSVVLGSNSHVFAIAAAIAAAIALVAGLAAWRRRVAREQATLGLRPDRFEDDDTRELTLV